MQKLLNNYKIKHFEATELLLASNTVPPEDLWLNIIPTLLIADQCRRELGFMIRINSAYRDINYNKSVKNSSRKSKHIIFNALDLTSWANIKSEINQLHEWFIDFKKCSNNNICREVCGIILYDWGVHIDTRGLHGYSFYFSDKRT